MNPAPEPLNARSLFEGMRYLEAKDPDLAVLFSQAGAPPMWGREPGFQTLVLIILEQQVSLASAHFAFQRLKEVARPLTPAHFLRCSHGELRKAGFSRQKMSYCRGLAESVLAGELCLKELESMDDDAARSRLTAIKGIGQWSADIYLLRALLRPDVWPSGDLALAKAVQELKGLTSRPAPNGLEAIAEPWRPWRAVAARTLWQFYLRSRGHR